jgi:gliding motility-associated-like protein
MGCTTEEEMTTWISGLTTVYQADTTNPVQGMNTYNFTTNYNWDGISNIVVQTCFFNDQWDDNLIQEHTTTTFNSTLTWRQDGNPDVCSEPNIFSNEMLRPNTFFTVCSGVDTTNVTYNWTPSGDVNDPNSGSPIATPSSSPTLYTLTVEDTVSGCSSDTTFTVSWYPDPDISFFPDPYEGVIPFTVNFNNTSGAGTGNYFWDFGDSTGTSTDANPSYDYTSPGTYYITLFGEDQWGCPGTWLDSIVVLDEPIIQIPNVFSPNGDGTNDEFAFIDYRGFSSFKFLVFNRWGMEVHSTTAIDVSNKVVWRPDTDTPEGTYFYIFEGRGKNGDQIKFEGHITLLR